MWDTKSCFTAQTSAWCGRASVSGTGFLSKVSTSTSGSTGGSTQNDPGFSRWQSLSCLDPGHATLSFSPSLGTELKSTRGEDKFRQSEVLHWLQDAHERLDSQLECLRTRDARLSHHRSPAQLLTMKHREQKVDTDLCTVREAEAKTRKRESHQNQTTTEQQSSVETQRLLLSRIAELNQMLSDSVQNHSEVQEQLIEANYRISHACLEKAILSTQVLKLEDVIKELKDKPDLIQRTRAGSDGSELVNNAEILNNKQAKEAVLMREESKGLREAKEKLTRELDLIKPQLEVFRHQLQELTADRVTHSKQITDLEAENSELMRENEELRSKVIQGGRVKDQCCQMRDSLEVLRLEKQNVQDRCLCLEAALVEKEEKLLQQEEESRKKDAARVQNIEELKAVASHWTEKWQKVALSLQWTREELEDLKKSKSNKAEEKASDSLLRLELDACKQELELERSRSHALLHRLKAKGAEAAQTPGRRAGTHLSESALSWEAQAQSKDDKQSVEGPVKVEAEQQRRRLTEQLKNLFKEREEINAGKVEEEEEEEEEEAQTEASSRPGWTSAPKAVKTPVERWSWQQSSGLMPLFEEDEEDSELTGEEEEDQLREEEDQLREEEDQLGEEEDQLREEVQGQGSLHIHQMSAARKANVSLKPEKENLLRDLRLKQDKDPTTTEENPDESDLQQKPSFLCPDGVFQAQRVDICSPDEDEEGGEEK